MRLYFLGVLVGIALMFFLMGCHNKDTIAKLSAEGVSAGITSPKSESSCLDQSEKIKELEAELKDLREYKDKDQRDYDTKQQEIDRLGVRGVEAAPHFKIYDGASSFVEYVRAVDRGSREFQHAPPNVLTIGIDDADYPDLICFDHGPVQDCIDTMDITER